MSPDSYFENVLNLNRHDTDYYFSQLKEKVNKTDWTAHGSPAVVNAIYDLTENSIGMCSFTLLTRISASNGN